jgi:hypothetical protein
MDDLFATVLAGEPPLRLTVDGMCASGRRQARQRQALMVVGLSALMAGATATVVVAAPSARGLPAPVGSGPATSVAPAPTTRPAGPLMEVPGCDGDPGALAPDVDEADGSVLPDPHAAAQAVLAAAPAIAPARGFGLITASRIDTSEKHPDGPRVYLIFNVSNASGVGSINMELTPQVGASAATRADYAVRARPFGNCVPPSRTDLPDGSVALAYIPFGDGDPTQTVQHTYYYGANGLDINVGVFLHVWPDRGQERTQPLATEMPLTPDEVIALARVVAGVR